MKTKSTRINNNEIFLLFAFAAFRRNFQNPKYIKKGADAPFLFFISGSLLFAGSYFFYAEVGLDFGVILKNGLIIDLS